MSGATVTGLAYAWTCLNTTVSGTKLPLMRHLLCIFTLSVLLTDGIALAQSGPMAPPSLSRYVNRPSLTESDLASIKAFVDREAPRLSSASPTEAVQARTKLLNDITSSTRRVSPIFREQYTSILEPHLRSAMDGDDIAAAVMAAQVTALLGTDGAVKMLTEHLNVADEPRNAVRVWAAGGLATLSAAPTVSERRLTRALRSLSIAAREEPNWAVRRRAIMAMAAAVSNQRGSDAGQKAIRSIAVELLSETLSDTLRSIGNGKTEFAVTLPIATTALQNTLLIVNSPEEQAKIAEHIVPMLASSHEAILQSWDAIRQNPRSLAATARFLDESELLLSILTKSSHENVQLSKAIVSGNRGPVEEASKRWQQHRG